MNNKSSSYVSFKLHTTQKEELIGILLDTLESEIEYRDRVPHTSKQVGWAEGFYWSVDGKPVLPHPRCHCGEIGWHRTDTEGKVTGIQYGIHCDKCFANLGK